jgi:hypothetical protein
VRNFELAEMFRRVCLDGLDAQGERFCDLGISAAPADKRGDLTLARTERGDAR